MIRSPFSAKKGIERSAACAAVISPRSPTDPFTILELQHLEINNFYFIE